MKSYSIEDVIKDVRIAIDQNISDNGLCALGDVETLSLNEIIKSKIVESVRIIHSAAPVYLLDGVDFGTIYIGAKSHLETVTYYYLKIS